MAINPLIVIALGVIVLVILIVIFRDQVSKGGDKYDEISDQAGLKSCSPLLKRSCVLAQKSPDGNIPIPEAKCPENKICCQA